MSNIEKDNLFEEVVNENAENPSVACGDSSPARGAEEADCHGLRPRNDEECRECSGEKSKYDFWAETRKQTQAEYRKIRVKEFFRALVEVGGYAALGGVMLAAMLLEMVPAYAAVPVFVVAWIWSAIRMDRYFRRWMF